MSSRRAAYWRSTAAVNDHNNVDPFNDIYRNGGYLSLLNMGANAVAVINAITEIGLSAVDDPRYVSRLHFLIQDRDIHSSAADCIKAISVRRAVFERQK